MFCSYLVHIGGLATLSRMCILSGSESVQKSRTQLSSTLPSFTLKSCTLCSGLYDTDCLYTVKQREMASHAPKPKNHQQNFRTVHRIYTVHKYNSIWVEAYIDHCACVVNLTLPLSLSLNKTTHRWPTEQSRTQESKTQQSSTLLYRFRP